MSKKSKEYTPRKITGDDIGDAVSDAVKNIDQVDAVQRDINQALRKGKGEKINV